MKFVSDDINDYCIQKSSTPSDLCQELAEYTRSRVPASVMLSGPLEGSLLRFLLGLSRAVRVLEFGTFTGYSALAMAECLPPDGEVITLDVNAETTQLAETFWRRSPHGHKIQGLIGPALESLAKLDGRFDAVFIDADKDHYLDYLRAGIELLTPNGFIAVDNCLWSGRVLDGKQTDAQTRAIREVNDFAKSNPQLQTCLLPVRDGILLIRKQV